MMAVADISRAGERDRTRVAQSATMSSRCVRMKSDSRRPGDAETLDVTKPLVAQVGGRSQRQNIVPPTFS